MKTLNLIPAFIFILLSLTSCKKDGPVVYVPEVKSTKEFIQKRGPQLQTKKIDGSVANSFTLKGGTKIQIPAGALTLNGQPVNGLIEIEALEMLNRSDILLSGTNTNHVSGAPLASDGFIYLHASVNGTPVDPKPAALLTVSIPAKRNGVTQIWKGIEDVDGTGQFGWDTPEQQANGGGIKLETAAFEGNFTFNMGELGWINCDVFYAYTNPKTTIRVNVANNPGAMAGFMALSGETFVFFCAKGSNVVAQIYTPDGPNTVKSYAQMMPVGVEGKYISFSIKEGKFYYAEQETTITDLQQITLTLVETTEQQIQQAINSLDQY